MLQPEHHARPRSRSMLLRVTLVLLAGIAAMILVNPSGTDFDDPVEIPGGRPPAVELVPFRP
ncbi:hypothetical protein GCM10028784_32740 [Myceligenerans cantabricum]